MQREDELSRRPPPIPMTPDLLEALEARWRAHGVPLLGKLHNGLAEYEIDALTAPLGLRVPVEARRWWGWHDGVFRADIRWAHDREVAAGAQFLSLAEAVAEYQTLRDEILAQHVAAANEPDAEGWWARSWFPFTRITGPVVCDCSVAEGDVTPIRVLDWGALSTDVKIPRAGSFGELVSWRIEAYDVGAYQFHETWVYDPYLLRDELQDSWLV